MLLAVILVRVTEVGAPGGIPSGTEVTPPLIEANTTVPIEQAAHWTEAHCHDDSPFDPFDVTMFVENVMAPELAFITWQEKPDPIFPGTAEMKTGLLQIMRALLCRLPSSIVSVTNSTTGRLHDCSFPDTHCQIPLKGWRRITLLVCAVQNVSLSDAGAAGGARSIVTPSMRFAYEIV